MSDRICEECRTPQHGKMRRGRCEKCYRRLLVLLRGGTPYTLPAGARALRRTVPGWGGCVVFVGKIDPHGYGVVKENGLSKRAHRVAYEYIKGPIPEGLQLDHACHTRSEECSGGVECRHRRCVNPHHLEPVAPIENTRRGSSPSSLNARKTHCKRGHEFTPENTIIQAPRSPNAAPERTCRTCDRQARRARSKASAQPS